jgi:hypothetical protein
MELQKLSGLDQFRTGEPLEPNSRGNTGRRTLGFSGAEHASRRGRNDVSGKAYVIRQAA